MTPLHGHLPSPGVLLVLVMARLVRPHRLVTAHWHCFLNPDNGLTGCLYALYQWLALQLVPHLSGLVTTSPLLAQELQRCGCSKDKVYVLPCSLGQHQEQLLLAMPMPEARVGGPLRVLFIGRLDSYKRLDFPIRGACSAHQSVAARGRGGWPQSPLFRAIGQPSLPSSVARSFSWQVV